MIEKIVSGGQTGADQGGLLAAKVFGVSTGGHAPKGYRTLDGPCPQLRELFGLEEHFSPSYAPRTHTNVRNSHGTIRFASNFASSGEVCTKKAICEIGRPYLDIHLNNPLPISVAAKWVEQNNITILNVAGNSEHTSPGIEQFVIDYMTQLLEAVNRNQADLIYSRAG
jgi:hypothetical protein